MDAGASPPLYLYAPGTVMKAEGVDDLSRSAARACRASESTAALRRIVTSEAERLGEPISLDLFATADNTLVQRFFAPYPEPLAESADALAQPDWGPAHTVASTTENVHRPSRLGASWGRSWPKRAPTASVA